jgi:hypothetical protein
MNLGWSPFKIVSVSAVLYPRWPPWLKIEISSNGQNCKGTTQGSFQQSLVEIGTVVSEDKIFFNFVPLFSNLHNWSKLAKFKVHKNSCNIC